MVDDEQRRRFEALRRERREELKRTLKRGFWDAAKREGFAAKGWYARRRREGAWQTLYLHKGGYYHVYLGIRFDRPDDPGPGSSSEYDVWAGLEEVVEERQGLEARRELSRAFFGGTPGDLALWPVLEAAANKHRLPWLVGAEMVPYAERAETLARYLHEVAMPWFDERPTPEALAQTHREKTTRLRMGSSSLSDSSA